MKKRQDIPELMESLESDRQTVFKTLDHFILTNRLITCHKKIIKRFIISDMLCRSASSYTILDIGAGACDIDRWLLKKCSKYKIDLKVTCIDNDPKVVYYAAHQVADSSRIKLIRCDAFDLKSLNQRFDYVFSNHLLHHLPEDRLAEFILKAASICDRVMVLNDLSRSRLAYYAVKILAPLFYHGSYARHDALASIKRSYKANELENHLRKANLKMSAHITKIFPAHICIHGSNPAIKYSRALAEQ